MRKLFYASIFICLLFTLIGVKTSAYVKTGHANFAEIEFVDKNNVLLVNRSANEINEGYEKLKKGPLFGWRTYYFNIDSQATYVGETIFSRSNRTGNIFSINYKINDEVFTNSSFRISGSVSSKINLKEDKKLSVDINPKFDISYDKTNRHIKEEEVKFELVIPPYKKLSLRVCGEAYVTSAVNKYYIFGICLKKGTWERVIVETKYYELIEESVS